MNALAVARVSNAKRSSYKKVLTLFVWLILATFAHQRSAAAASAAENSLSFDGLTLYGAIDIGLQYQTHGAPISDYFPGGSTSIVQRDGNRSIFAATPNNLGQSKIGLSGIEPILHGWSAVLKLETFFDPQSGELSDGPRSLTLNNGRALASQTTNADSSVAGQAFQQSYIGIDAPSFGRLTFGRQNTVLADGIAKYDPNYAALAFSLIGQSGTASGGGYTQDRRLDSSLKYESPTIRAAHWNAQYKSNESSGSAGTVFEVNVGVELRYGSIDAYYSKIKDAISASALTADQVSLLPSLGLTSNKSLSAVVSDNEAFALMGLLRMNPTTVFLGYERIRYANPSSPLSAGFDDIGGYKLAFVNNLAYPKDKVQQVYWTGVQYQLAQSFGVSAAFYGYAQNSYGTQANSSCGTSVSPTCSGTLEAFALLADYHLTPRFDSYAGMAYTTVHRGFASGYLHSSDMDPTIGIRYVF